MKKMISLLITITFATFVMLVSCTNVSDENKTDNKAAKIIEKKVEKESSKQSLVVSQLKKIAGDFTFTEGPAVDAKGNVYFTDVPKHLIFVWTLEDKLDTFRVNSGRANGLYFDKDENLLACEGEKGQISLTTPAGEYKVIASQYNGKRFNQPNDIWPDSKGGVYFSDPKFGENQNEISQDGMHVYYITPDHSSVIKVIEDFEKPNGLIGTPDGKTLYVTDAQAQKTYKYDVNEDGSLANKKLFVNVGADGMTIDKTGNVYLTTSGKNAVDIFSPTGELLESIKVPERVSNLCFTGKDRNQLFITALTSIYRIQLNTQGVD